MVVRKKFIKHKKSVNDLEVYLAEVGYDPDLGARPLKRAIQRELQDSLALNILPGDFREGDVVRVDEGRMVKFISRL
jgi:ATP-dependent Clp protease ATP-binding subunit ClpA